MQNDKCFREWDKHGNVIEKYFPLLREISSHGRASGPNEKGDELNTSILYLEVSLSESTNNGWGKKEDLTLKNARRRENLERRGNKLPKGYRDVFWMCPGQDTEFPSVGVLGFDGPTTSRTNLPLLGLKSIVGAGHVEPWAPFLLFEWICSFYSSEIEKIWLKSVPI